MPESIEKKISISLMFAGFSTRRELINFITSGFTKLSASVEISITQYAIITIAPEVLPRLGSIYRMKQVELRVDEHGARLLQEAQIDSVPATEDDWRTEYLAPILAIRVVKSLDEAIAHINEYGSHHTDSIITQNHAHGMRFLREVDSASVMINASTRFADGFEYGLGAEIGISTDKLHARGPVGLEGLTSQKYVVFGHVEIRT